LAAWHRTRRTARHLVIDHSTIDPEAARRIAGELRTREIGMLDAPVSGGSIAAEAGTLAIMVGGSRAELDRATPVLSSYAKSIVHIGPNGAGQVAKACNQICTIVNQLGAAEAMLLAERAGVDPRAVKDALMGGFAASRMLDLQAPKMIERNFEGKVESRLHHKDIHIVLDLARGFGIELPASAAAAAVLDRLQERGGARRTRRRYHVLTRWIHTSKRAIDRTVIAGADLALYFA
jgi:2-hydroxy-3-oxopropionate reductase